MSFALPIASVVELPYEAGIRFECWIKHNAPEELIHRVFRTVDVDSEDPKRQVELQGIIIRWPTGRVHTECGAIPRPAMWPQRTGAPV